MLNRFFKNHFWIEQGIETLWMAWYLEYFQNVFAGRQSYWVDSLFGHLDDPWVPMALTAVGVFVIVVAQWDINWFGARYIMVSSLQFTWTLFAVAFIWHDLRLGVPGWMTGISVIVCIRIFVNFIKPTYQRQALTAEVNALKDGGRK